jgi:uncharacterized protein (DUF983 family)
MTSAFLSALFGRCPCCGRGKLYTSFLTLHETCEVCHVRFERWSGSWTIPVVMGYGAGALFAIALGFWFHEMGRLAGSENILIPATIAFTAAFYPVCKNVSMFMLFQNGFIFVDPPTLVRPPPEDDALPMQSAVRPPHRSLILSSTLPLEDEPTREEGSVPHEDDPTDGGGGAAA